MPRDLLDDDDKPAHLPGAERSSSSGDDRDPAKRARTDDRDDDDPPEGGSQDERVIAERRRKRVAQREAARQGARADAAEAFARELAERFDNLERLVIGQSAEQAGRSLDAKIAAARDLVKKARDEQDLDAELEAASQLQTLERRKEQLDASVRAAREKKPSGAGGADDTTDGQRRSGPTREAQAWLRRNTWFDPNGSDLYSSGAIKISEALLEEGYPADDPEHFAELDRRLKRELPGLSKRKKAAETAEEDDIDLPGTVSSRRSGSGGSSRDDDDDDDRRGPPRPTNADVRRWKEHVKPDFDPANKDHVREFLGYRQKSWEKNHGRRSARG